MSDNTTTSKNHDIKKIIIKILPWVYLAAVFIFSMVFFMKNVEHLMDSDETSELILGKLLSKEHGILSKNWYYSTELRLLNNQLVFALVFLFTDSFKAVRIISTVILGLIILASFYFFCRQAGIKKYFPFMAAFLIAPFSMDYAEYILFGLYYIPHMCLSFLIMGLVLKCENVWNEIRNNADANKTKFYIYLAGTGILSLLAGMGGPRQAVILFIPLLLTLLLRLYQHRKLEYIGGYVSAVAGMAGYVVNAKILSNIYSFHTWDNLDFSGFSISRIGDLLGSLLETIGYSYGPVFSYSLISNGIVFLYVLLLVLYFIHICRHSEKIEDTEKFVALFFIIAVVAFILLYTLTTMPYKNRYALPVLVFAFPFIGYAFEKHDWKIRSVVIGCVVAVLVNVLAAFPVYKAETVNETTYSLRGIAQYAVENDFHYGFATFWNANILTELTDGQMDMYCFGENAFEGNDITDTFKWLQVKEHDTVKPDGRVMLILSDQEISESTYSLYLSPETANYFYGNLFVWVYDSYEDMVSALSSYSMDMAMTDYIAGGELVGKEWYIYSGGATRGPYNTLYAGSYRITVKGQKLGQCSFSANGDLGETPIELLPENSGEDEVTFIVCPETTITFFDLSIINGGEDSVTVSSISVQRIY